MLTQLRSKHSVFLWSFHQGRMGIWGGKTGAAEREEESPSCTLHHLGLPSPGTRTHGGFLLYQHPQRTPQHTGPGSVSGMLGVKEESVLLETYRSDVRQQEHYISAFVSGASDICP